MPILSSFLLCLSVQSASSDPTDTQRIDSSRTGFHPWGGRGLTQTLSAFPLGSGRVVASLQGGMNPTSYPVPKSTRYTPPLDASVRTILVSAAYGLRGDLDLSGWIAAYSIPDWTKNPYNTGIGSTSLAIQYSPQYDWELPVRVAVQAQFVGGTSTHPIHTGYDSIREALYADGYTYFLSRMDHDFALRLLQTAWFQHGRILYQFHANEGLVISPEPGRDAMLVFDAGVAVTPHPLVTLGLEGHVRTRTPIPAYATDPRWITLSATTHLPRKGPDLGLGIDIRQNDRRDKGLRKHALDPWRATIQMSMPVDLLARIHALRESDSNQVAMERRKLRDSLAVNDKRRRELYEARLRLDSLELELARIARRDSLAAAKLAEDATRESERQRRRADSLNARLREDDIRGLDASNPRGATFQVLDGSLRGRAARRQLEENIDAELRTTGGLQLDGVYFAKNSHSIASVSHAYLDIVGSRLARNPKLRIEVGGHTDNTMSAKEAREFSLKRAQAVRDYFVAKFPGLRNSLTVKGYGDVQPVSSNLSEEGRSTNRRVELLVLNPEELSKLRR
jgi:outer membrane protein OmpA-like peptidoglycan-associated protein